MQMLYAIPVRETCLGLQFNCCCLTSVFLPKIMHIRLRTPIIRDGKERSWGFGSPRDVIKIADTLLQKPASSSRVIKSRFELRRFFFFIFFKFSVADDVTRAASSSNAAAALSLTPFENEQISISHSIFSFWPACPLLVNSPTWPCRCDMNKELDDLVRGRCEKTSDARTKDLLRQACQFQKCTTWSVKI